LKVLTDRSQVPADLGTSSLGIGAAKLSQQMPSGSLSEFLARVLDHLVPDVWFEETVQELIDQSVCPAAVGGITLCRLTYQLFQIDTELIDFVGAASGQPGGKNL
jgi:hypothetical protein